MRAQGEAESTRIILLLQTMAEISCQQPGCGDATSDCETEEKLCLRSMRPLFDEEGIVDQTKGIFEFECARGGPTICIEQLPRLAARLDSADLPVVQVIGSSITEAYSATGAVVWDSTICVSRFLEAEKEADRFCVRDRSVFELGSGAGLLTCVAWALGASQVIATERPELIRLLRRNVEMNCHEQSGTVAPIVTPHMWGETIEPEFKYPDIILAVDCIYDEESVPLLLDSICALVSDDRAQSVLVAVDESYKRPKALVLFMASLEPRGLRAVALPTNHLLPTDRRESIRLWSLVA